MVRRLNAKLPYGFSNSFWQDRLNEAFMWIEQQGPFKWDVATTNVTLSLTKSTGPLPNDFQAGSEAVLVDMTSGLEILYLPQNEFRRESVFTPDVAPTTGVYSAWTYYKLLGFPNLYYVFEVTPNTAFSAPGTVFFLIYHTSPNSFYNLTIGPTNYFPTPDEFDSLIMLRAEAETRLLYELGAYMARMKEAEDLAAKLLDRYRSTALDPAGMVDEMRKLQETQGKRVLA